MATVAAGIQENWIQDFANWINSKTVSVYEAVAITGLSYTRVHKRIRQKRIRAVRIAGNWRVVRVQPAKACPDARGEGGGPISGG
jgi:hypothetical protein